jgi:predicted  nucleic acid-binding Zn-ribbon protein
VLERELRKLNEENKNLKKEQRDRDSQLVESRKLIEKLSSSQKQLAS